MNTQLNAKSVAKAMDVVVEKGKAQNWDQAQYKAELTALLAEQRQNLRTANSPLKAKARTDTMNLLYFWESSDCPDEHTAVYVDEISMDRFLFRKGVFIKKEQINKPIIFDLTVSKAEIAAYDDMPNNSASPLVNQKMMDLLLAIAPNDVQFFDAEVHCHDGVLTNYKLLNITRTVVGIDREQSIYTKSESLGAIRTVRRLVYNPGCMKNHLIARDAEYLGNILVTEEIKQVFEKAKINGAQIFTPEDYYRNVWE
jgi:hypothetical protein